MKLDNCDAPKKRFERIFLNEFLTHHSLCIDRIIPTERPDFLLHVNGLKIGIEITRCYKDATRKGSPLRTLEQLRYKYIMQVCHRYYKLFYVPISCTFLFRKTRINGHPREEDMACFLHESARCLLPLNDKNPLHETGKEVRHPSGIRVWIRRLPTELSGYDRWQVSDNTAGRVGLLTPTILQDVIDNKNTLADIYKQTCDVLWLLVCVETDKGSGMMDWDPKFAMSIDRLNFDAVWLLLHRDSLHFINGAFPLDYPAR